MKLFAVSYEVVLAVAPATIDTSGRTACVKLTRTICLTTALLRLSMPLHSHCCPWSIPPIPQQTTTHRRHNEHPCLCSTCHIFGLRRSIKLQYTNLLQHQHLYEACKQQIWKHSALMQSIQGRILLALASKQDCLPVVCKNKLSLHSSRINSSLQGRDLLSPFFELPQMDIIAATKFPKADLFFSKNHSLCL